MGHLLCTLLLGSRGCPDLPILLVVDGDTMRSPLLGHGGVQPRRPAWTWSANWPGTLHRTPLWFDIQLGRRTTWSHGLLHGLSLLLQSGLLQLQTGFAKIGVLLWTAKRGDSQLAHLHKPRSSPAQETGRGFKSQCAMHEAAWRPQHQELGELSVRALALA